MAHMAFLERHRSFSYHDSDGDSDNDDSDEYNETDDNDDEIALEAASKPLLSPTPEVGRRGILPPRVEQDAAKNKPPKSIPGAESPEAPCTSVQRPSLVDEKEANPTPSTTQAFQSGSKDPSLPLKQTLTVCKHGSIPGCSKPQRSPPFETDDELPTKKVRNEDQPLNNRSFWLESFMDIPQEISRAIAAEQSVDVIGSTLVPVMAEVDIKDVWQDLKKGDEKVVHNASTLFKKRNGKWRVTGEIRARNLTFVKAKGLRLSFPQSLR